MTVSSIYSDIVREHGKSTHWVAQEMFRVDNSICVKFDDVAEVQMLVDDTCPILEKCWRVAFIPGFLDAELQRPVPRDLQSTSLGGSYCNPIARCFHYLDRLRR